MLYEPSRPLVSLHIPKTAGTSFRSVLAGWFGPDLHEHYFSRETGKPSLHSLGPGSCVHGHFNANRGFGSTEYYPEHDQYITFLREPFSRCVSIWRYEKHKERNRDPASDTKPAILDFEPWLFRKVDDHRRTGASFLVQLPGHPDPQAIQHILRSRFVNVGITEDYATSVSRMADALGKPVPEHLDTLNVTEGNSRDFTSYRALYEREFPEEYEVYETGRSLHTELLAG